MQKVLTAEQMREIDRLTTEKYGIPSIILMENAAHAVVRVITEKLGGSVKGKSILILCGKGNNGGDGAAVARILWQAEALVDVVLFGKLEQTKGDARSNFEFLEKLRTEFPQDWEIGEKSDGGSLRFLQLEDGEYFKKRYRPAYIDPIVVVDALVGTGLNRPADHNLYQVMCSEWLEEKQDRHHQFELISVDIPSGLNANEENSIGMHVRADTTVTFTAPKLANVLGEAAVANGNLIVANIGTPQALVNRTGSENLLSEHDDAYTWLRRAEFSSDSYKNKRGHTLLIAGSEDYSGAAVLAGNSAMRSGVGLVTLAAPKECKSEIASRLLPEVILKSIDSANDSSKADAIAVGCGLSTTDPAIEKLVRKIVETRKVPVIIDAGALSFFSPISRLTVGQGESPIILTPHEGEFMRLLGTDDKDAIKDRVAAVRDFATTHNVILVLKGERVLIGAPDGKVVVNPTGNSGLGKAGNGDTLTGILAGFAAQANAMDIDIFETVVAAVYLAGMAGDIAEMKFGKRVMTASDVRECLVKVFAEFEKK